jgi:eukaryotic-like serine/threonine-protein kinase
MSDQEYDLEQIFDQARRIDDPEARAEYLGKVCDGDHALLLRLENLIASQQMADSFFSASECAVADSDEVARLRALADPTTPGGDDWVEDRLGVTLGRYHLIERIGDGGSGVVYLAEQEEPVRRIVAVKMVRIGIDSEQVVARFKAERQALAMMDHPNIARVFDAGETKTGAPYLVMEHVRGTRITEYCQQNHLSLDQRLDLFIQVCHAIQHAHQKGIIHGDIKPANIIVSYQDGINTPKVIDFGVARVTESRLFGESLKTGDTQILGTPAYMSPEQLDCNGFDLDTRSDIYSLGVLLFELLTGTTPIATETLAELSAQQLRHALQMTELPSPSERIGQFSQEECNAWAASHRASGGKLLESLRQDLDFVVRKCLEKNRSLRYQTANALAMDLQRFLHNEVVLSRPPAWRYYWGRFIRRNRGVFLAGTLVAATLVAGMSASTWLYVKERTARQRAVAAEQQQMRLREQAEKRERTTQAALLISQDRHEEADQLVADLVFSDSSMEGASVLRSLGEWHALNERWSLSAVRFEALLRVHHFESADVSSLDFLELGPVLFKAGMRDRYRQFARDTVEHFNKAPNLFADRYLKICLLMEAEPRLIRDLKPVAEVAETLFHQEEAAGDLFGSGWRVVALALYAYRSGHHDEAIRWTSHVLNYSENNAPRALALLATKALAHYALGQSSAASESLERASMILASRPRVTSDRGSPVHGFWFDWAFAQILIEEAKRE